MEVKYKSPKLNPSNTGGAFKSYHWGRLLAIFKYKDILLHIVVENNGFQSLFNVLEPRWVLHTSKHFEGSADLKPVFK